jgi:hypothetical protein
VIESSTPSLGVICGDDDAMLSFPTRDSISSLDSCGVRIAYLVDQ